MSISIGIDIGASYTKVVELDHKTHARLTNHFIFKTPYLPPGQANKKIIDADSFWAEVTKYIPLQKIKSASIGVNLPSNLVTAMTLLLPRVAKAELTLVAQTEARRKMIPASSPSHIFETFLVGERIAAKITRFEVLVVRVEQCYVQQILDLFKKIDTYPNIITLPSSALFTLFPQEIADKKEEDAAFVDLGLSSISISIFREGKLNFFRNTAFGLQDIIQDIGIHLSLTNEEVEGIIKEKGVPQVQFDLKNKVALAEEIMRQKYEAGVAESENNQKQQVNLLELRAIWQGHIERIVTELRRSLAYYKEQTSGRRVEYIYFSGGGCHVNNLIDKLTENMGGHLQVMFPFKDMRLPQEKVSEDERYTTPIFTNATSMALCLFVKRKDLEIINFLPYELKRKEVIATRRLIFLIVKISLIAVFGLLAASMFINNRSVRTSIKKVDVDLERVRKVSESLKNLTSMEIGIKKEAIGIRKIVESRQDLSLPLRGLIKALPREILLTRLIIYKGQKEPVAAAAVVPEAQDASVTAGQEAGQVQPPVDTITQIVYQSSSGAQKYQIVIDAQVFADYEEAGKIVESLRGRLQKTQNFSNIFITPFKLEEIVSAMATSAGQESRLTEPKERVFTLSADISPRQ